MFENYSVEVTRPDGTSVARFFGDEQTARDCLAEREKCGLYASGTLWGFDENDEPTPLDDFMAD